MSDSYVFHCLPPGDFSPIIDCRLAISRVCGNSAFLFSLEGLKTCLPVLGAGFKPPNLSLTWEAGLSFRSDFEPQDEVSGDPEDDEERDQADDVDPEDPVVQRHLLQELLRILEVTVGLKTFQQFTKMAPQILLVQHLCGILCNKYWPFHYL